MSAKDLVEVGGKTYVLTSSSRVDDRIRVLKHGDSFAVFDRFGDINPIGTTEQGLFLDGTRCLSRQELLIQGERPLPLNSTVKNHNTLLAVDLTTPTIEREGKPPIRSGTVHIFRSKVLWRGACHEQLRLSNYGTEAIALVVDYAFEADYADIFEVRGARRARRGRHMPAERESHALTLGYEGLDGVPRHTRIEAARAPDRMDERTLSFDVTVPPDEWQELLLTISFWSGERAGGMQKYGAALRESARTLRRRRVEDCTVFTSNEQLNDWLNRAQADIHMLVTYTDSGPYPYAGIPWFNTPFGRDGIITALEYLWINPALARGVLGYLAAHQATETDLQREAEPGKILHEVRGGEMAALGEIPFRSYYGTVDATPLFLVLAGEYYRRTADRPFLESIWPNIEAALGWIDHYGDPDGDGFVEYERHNPRGLVHQGWKDSDDSVFHADGTPAEGLIALCEVQGYVYAAWREVAALMRVFGERREAAALDERADDLKTAFNARFWCDDLSTFALALDGDKRVCRVKASNAGHALLTGIADEAHVRRTAETLLARRSFSGWGVRTLASNEARYNPMSYHNGSIWPHDNALIAMGLARCGHRDKGLRLLTGLFDATMYMDLHRLPELFCGFDRRRDEPPAVYPTACAPQAWASASVFYLLQAALGLSFNAPAREIRFDHPALPSYLQWLEIRNLRLGEAVVDLVLKRHQQDVSVNVLRKRGDLRVAVTV
ncbi:MAG: amylo-alpha-1,6-glucosidase [Gammaproteobacteria bacterium]|nr:amylo-alpha-1,6-glucosidase [Gammaproteobacteria bacterium]